MKASILKKGYSLPRPIMRNSDLNRIINSQEIQSAIRPKRQRATFEKKRNPLKHPQLFAKLNPLFDTQWKEIQKTYRDGAKPRTTRVLKPLKKKQRVMLKLSDKEKEQMKPYWKNVFGDDRIFKSSALLAAEKEAVKQAIAAQEREKAGLDLMEALAAKAGDDDEDSS